MALPTVVFDNSYLMQIIDAPDALVAAWLLLKAGGWIPALIVTFKGLSWAWLDERAGVFLSKQKQVFLAIDIPKTNEQLPKAVENLFAHLQGAYSSPTKKEKWMDGKVGPIFSFEIVSIGGYIQFVIMCWEKYRDVVEALIYAQYPEAEITEIEDYTKFAPQKWPNKDYLLFASEFCLKNNMYYPLKTYPEFEEKLAGEFKDPMAGFLEAISKLNPTEQVWFQLLIQLGPQDWSKGAEKLIKKLIGAPKPKVKDTILDKIVDAPMQVLSTAVNVAVGGESAPPKKEEKGPRSEMLFLSAGEKLVAEAVERKVTKIGHASKIRFLYFAPNKDFRTSTVIAFVRGAMQQFTSHDLNALKFETLTLTRRDYFWQLNSFFHYLSLTFYKTVNERMRLNFRGYKNRSLWSGGHTFHLNTEELATLWHFPVNQVKAPLVKKTEAKRAEPPIELPVGTAAARPSSLRSPERAPAMDEPRSHATKEGPPANLPTV
jgi:hypothetical protein